MGKEQVITVSPRQHGKIHSAKALKLQSLMNYMWDQQNMKANPTAFVGKGQMAAYKAWIKRHNNAQDTSPTDLELSPVERVTKDVIKELRCRG